MSNIEETIPSETNRHFDDASAISAAPAIRQDGLNSSRQAELVCGQRMWRQKRPLRVERLDGPKGVRVFADLLSSVGFLLYIACRVFAERSLTMHQPKTLKQRIQNRVARTKKGRPTSFLPRDFADLSGEGPGFARSQVPGSRRGSDAAGLRCLRSRDTYPVSPAGSWSLVPTASTARHFRH